jgi:predicted RNase H-like HicB family nuclease
MKFIITIQHDEDGIFVAECPSIPGCVSQGSTIEEAEHNIKDAIKECIAARRDLGLPETVDVREIEVPVV